MTPEKLSKVKVVKYNGVELNYDNSWCEQDGDKVYIYERHEFDLDDVKEITETIYG